MASTNILRHQWTDDNLELRTVAIIEHLFTVLDQLGISVEIDMEQVRCDLAIEDEYDGSDPTPIAHAAESELDAVREWIGRAMGDANSRIVLQCVRAPCTADEDVTV